MISLLLCMSVPSLGESRWGADYFPNVPLVTHEGETLYFFEDMIKDKVVVINFIYTICPDSCPLETARLARVQEILGDRVGKDIFIYSITIDPENDTPEVLAKYAERYRAKPGWWFLTGKESDITLLRRKLGLYLEEIQDDSNNHNLSLIIGNQGTGQWMRRSPFENPYVLATQIGSWLSGWKAPSKAPLDYADAPDVRNISQGEQLFRTRCATCHTIGNGIEGLPEGLVGPDLLGVTRKRERKWLRRWLAVPDKMLEEGDPIALALYAQYNNLPMPNMRLSKVDVKDLLRYISGESNRVEIQRARDRKKELAALRMPSPEVQPESAESGEDQSGDAVAIMNAWVRQAHPDAVVNAAYMTLVNVSSADVTLVKLRSPAFEKVELHEMSMEGGMMKMGQLNEVIIPAAGQTRFEPGGMHLMLHGPKSHLSAGQTVDLTLTFSSGREQAVAVKVLDR
jgi:protein SCO1/2